MEKNWEDIINQAKGKVNQENENQLAELKQQIQNIYVYNINLISYFEGVKHQLETWLNSNVLTVSTTQAILQNLQNDIQKLADLKFEIDQIEYIELNPELSKYLNYIRQTVDFSQIEKAKNKLLNFLAEHNNVIRNQKYLLQQKDQLLKQCKEGILNCIQTHHNLKIVTCGTHLIATVRFSSKDNWFHYLGLNSNNTENILETLVKKEHVRISNLSTGDLRFIRYLYFAKKIELINVNVDKNIINDISKHILEHYKGMSVDDNILSNIDIYDNVFEMPLYISNRKYFFAVNIEKRETFNFQYGLPNLEHLYIENTNIHPSVFHNCRELKTLTLNNVVSELTNINEWSYYFPKCEIKIY